MVIETTIKLGLKIKYSYAFELFMDFYEINRTLLQL